MGIGAFLRSRKNLVGCILALVALAVPLSGAVPLVAGIPIVVAAYLVGALVTPAPSMEAAHFDVTGNDEQIKLALEKLLRQVQGRVPEDVLLRVQSIRNSILATLRDPNTAPGAVTPARSSDDPNIYLIQQTALQYLPTALETYISLPRRYTLRDLPGRKNAHQMLISQLDLMDQKLAEVTDAILARDAQRLEVYGRFIQEKFGSSGLDLDKFQMTQAASDASVAETPVSAPTVDITSTAAASGPGGEQPQPPTMPEPADLARASALREREAVARAAERARATGERLAEAARANQAAREQAQREALEGQPATTPTPAVPSVEQEATNVEITEREHMR